MWLMLRTALLIMCVFQAFAQRPEALAQWPEALAQWPEFYKQVSRITWVTRDADRTAAAWTKFGLTDAEPRGEVALPIEYRGKPLTARARWTTARIGAVAVDLLEPVADTGALGDHLARHGEGIVALLHEAGSREAFDREVDRMRALGVGILQRGSEPVPYVWFDTAERGKYVVGLVLGAPRGEGPGRIGQFAFAVRDAAPVAAYWKSLGWPAMTVSRSVPRGMEVHGKPASYELEIWWQRHGAVPYEWCVAPAGLTSVYGEFVARHGEGVQHLGIAVPDMDRAIAEKGFAVAQSGAWGEAGKPGSGRFAYLDTDAAGGVTAELLWSFR